MTFHPPTISCNLAAGAAALPSMSLYRPVASHPSSRPVSFDCRYPAGLLGARHHRTPQGDNGCRSGSATAISSSTTALCMHEIFATEVVGRATPDTIRFFCQSGMHQRDAHQNTHFTLSRTPSGREHRGRPLLHGGHPISAGQNLSGFHRLCQGQSWQGPTWPHGSGTTTPCLRRLLKRYRCRFASLPYRIMYVPDLLSGHLQVAFSSISAVDRVLSEPASSGFGGEHGRDASDMLRISRPALAEFGAGLHPAAVRHRRAQDTSRRSVEKLTGRANPSASRMPI